MRDQDDDISLDGEEQAAAGPAPAALGDGWCLRFLSGAVKGRTIALKPGLNVLGSGGDCEVMLPGGDVLPRHLAFTVGELVVSMQRLGTASARLNGEDMRQPRRSVVAGDVVSLGRSTSSSTAAMRPACARTACSLRTMWRSPMRSHRRARRRPDRGAWATGRAA